MLRPALRESQRLLVLGAEFWFAYDSVRAQARMSSDERIFSADH